jgi:hypothetical protein
VGEEEKKEQWERNMTIGVTISTKNHQNLCTERRGGEVQNAVVLNQMEVREILADYFNIPIENVINSKYSYIIIKKEESDGRKLQD